MQLCDEAPKYLIVLVAIKQSTPFLRLSRVLLSLYILQIRPSALTRFCPSTIYQYNSPLPQNVLRRMPQKSENQSL